MPVNIFTTIDDPSNNFNTEAEGINGSGQIVGSFSRPSGRGTDFHGFVLGGSFTTFDDPLSGERTQAVGINDTGQIVGSYADTQFHAFFLSGTVFFTLDPPSTTTRSEASTTPARSSGTSRMPPASMASSVAAPASS